MKENEPLARHTSWRIGGPARYYTDVTSMEALHEAIRRGRERELPLFLLGGGTNLLVQDSGFGGLVIRYAARDWHIEPHDERGLLYVEAGATMAGLARRVSGQGWSGLEWAEGLPGTVGGALYGNAGCYGGDIASILQRAWLLVDDELQVWGVEQLHYGYRTSILKAAQPPAGQPAHRQDLPPVVLAAEFRLERADAAALAETMARTAALRKEKTPWGSSCGSVFKNLPARPGQPAIAAGYLIDQAGLKGRRIGAAEISQKHANYIINLGGASSKDVLQLIDLIRNTVLRVSGIELELEIQILP